MSHKTPKTPLALVLPGGGARAAYQVGVLQAILQITRERTAPGEAPQIPFRIITGTSAGAINAASLASNAMNFEQAIERLQGVWRNFAVDKVFRCDTRTVLSNAWHWLVALSRGTLGQGKARSLLDNEPLRALLEAHIRMARIDQAIRADVLQAVAVTAAGYSGGRAVSFYQSREPVAPWSRRRRQGREEALRLEHLMGSVAVPFIFPAVNIGGEYFGDGAVREGAPLSPAIHMGAERLLVIGVRDPREPPEGAHERPSFGYIAGYMLDALFQDGLQSDIERLARLNRIVEQAGGEAIANLDGVPFRRITARLIVPSESVTAIAQRHANRFPRAVKAMLRAIGGGAVLKSFLLFDSHYCGELVDMGYADAMARRAGLEAFLFDSQPPGDADQIYL